MLNVIKEINTHTIIHIMHRVDVLRTPSWLRAALPNPTLVEGEVRFFQAEYQSMRVLQAWHGQQKFFQQRDKTIIEGAIFLKYASTFSRMVIKSFNN